MITRSSPYFWRLDLDVNVIKQQLLYLSGTAAQSPDCIQFSIREPSTTKVAALIADLTEAPDISFYEIMSTIRPMLKSLDIDEQNVYFNFSQGRIIVPIELYEISASRKIIQYVSANYTE